mmetsp:Transcript_31854/g.105617  ORF Transcript_31854/g.105617 Transcript_31854/m.105617 type:complete len:328 (+) Transcript_31854:341-1324(+)
MPQELAHQQVGRSLLRRDDTFGRGCEDSSIKHQRAWHRRWRQRDIRERQSLSDVVPQQRRGRHRGPLQRGRPSEALRGAHVGARQGGGGDAVLGAAAAFCPPRLPGEEGRAASRCGTQDVLLVVRHVPRPPCQRRRDLSCDGVRRSRWGGHRGIAARGCGDQAGDLPMLRVLPKVADGRGHGHLRGQRLVQGGKRLVERQGESLDQASHPRARVQLVHVRLPAHCSSHIARFSGDRLMGGGRERDAERGRRAAGNHLAGLVVTDLGPTAVRPRGQCEEGEVRGRDHEARERLALRPSGLVVLITCHADPPGVLQRTSRACPRHQGPH